MTRFFVSVLAVSVLALSVSGLAAQEKRAATEEDQPATQEEMSPETLQQKYSYLIGYKVIKDLQREEIGFDLKELLEGIQDASDGKTPTMTDEEIRSVELALDKILIRKQQDRMAKITDENLRRGTEFLKANLLNEGVKEMENGLQYKVLAEGEGESPRITDSVKVHYKGMFIDGTVWATTSGSGPVSLAVGGVGIRALATALQKMKPGDKWKVFIPSNLAFGVQGNLEMGIGPNQVLIYELELIEIMK